MENIVKILNKYIKDKFPENKKFFVLGKSYIPTSGFPGILHCKISLYYGIKSNLKEVFKIERNEKKSDSLDNKIFEEFMKELISFLSSEKFKQVVNGKFNLE